MILKEIHNEYLLLDNKVSHLDDKFELIDFGLKLITQPHCIPNGEMRMQSFIRVEEQFENDYPYHILYVDRFKNKYGVLNKLHNAMSLHVFELDQIDEWKQTNATNDNDILIELRFIINEKMPKENLKKTLISIKFLDDKQIFITSKQGEIFLISFTKQVKQFKLDANVISDKYFYKLPTEIHIKGIYLINNYQYKYYTVGVDRIIFSFCIEDGQIFDYHKFACLAGQVNKLQISKEKNLKYYHDKTLKSLQKINILYISMNFGKQLFFLISISLFQEYIVIIQKEQKTKLYDIYQEQQSDKYVCEDPISKIEWLNSIHKSFFTIKNKYYIIRFI